MATLATGLRARFGRAGLAPAGFHQGFHRLISVPPLPRFSQRNNNVGPVKLFLSTLLSFHPKELRLKAWVIIYAYNHHVRLLLPNLRSSINHSLLGSRSRHCYEIKFFWAYFACSVSVYQAVIRRYGGRLTNPKIHKFHFPPYNAAHGNFPSRGCWRGINSPGSPGSLSASPVCHD